MGSTCSKGQLARRESKRRLREEVTSIPDLERTIGENRFENTREKESKEEPVKKEKRAKISYNQQFWSNGSGGEIVERFKTQTLKLDQPIISSIKQPNDTDRKTWIYENALYFIDEIQLIYDSISDSCTPESCPEMTAGPHYTYLWTDNNQKIPRKCPACEYINLFFNWLDGTLRSDPFKEIEKGEFPEDFMQIMKAIYKRIFRIYAHVYHHHLQEFIHMNAEIHLNTTFKHFGLFAREFGLISKKEEAPLRKLLKQLIQEEERTIEESTESTESS